MTHEQEFFIQILSDHLNGRPTEYKRDLNGEEVDWESIKKLAITHQVDGIVYTQCKNFMPDELRELYRKKFMGTLFRYTNRIALMQEVEAVFRQKGLFYFTVKGITVSKLYPRPALRTMADCDIVTHREEMGEVIQSLCAVGFVGPDTMTLEQWGGERNQLHFEVHDRLVQEGEYASSRQASFFNHYDDYVTDHMLDPSFHFLFLLMHLRKHFLNRGVGIRQFMDLAVMIRNEPTLRWEWIEEILRTLKFVKYAHVCYALIDYWFGIKAPVDYQPLGEDFVEQISIQILLNGVFGFADGRGRKNDAQTALVITSGPNWLRRIKILWKKTFLSYEIMRGYPGCAFVDGKRWLMPVAWVKRLFILLSRKDKTRSMSVIKSSNASQEELEEREQLLRGMGLI